MSLPLIVSPYRILVMSMSNVSESLRPAEQTAVHGVNDWLCRNSSTTEEATIQALDGILTTRDSLELEVDVTLSVGVQRDVHDMAVLGFAFGADIVLEFLLPVFAFFSVYTLAMSFIRWTWSTYSAGSNIFRSSTHRLAWLTLTGSGLDSFFTWMAAALRF